MEGTTPGSRDNSSATCFFWASVASGFQVNMTVWRIIKSSSKTHVVEFFVQGGPWVVPGDRDRGRGRGHRPGRSRAAGPEQPAGQDAAEQAAGVADPADAGRTGDGDGQDAEVQHPGQNADHDVDQVAVEDPAHQD